MDERASAPRIRFAVPSIEEDDIAAVSRVLRGAWITSGEEVEGLERDLAQHLGAEYVVAVSSCTAALEIALAHQPIPSGALVAVPTWTFVSTALSVLRAGFVPVIVDVDPVDLNLSVAALEHVIEQVAAVIPVHFGGVPVSAAIRELADANDVVVIEDAAHAFGARDERGLIAGREVAAACFSFYATKNLTSGEGGALATADAELAAFARVHRQHGLSRDAWRRYLPGSVGEYGLESLGLKANLADPAAALARSQLRRYESMQRWRRELVCRYRQDLCAVDGVAAIPAHVAEGSADHLMVVKLPEGVDRPGVQAAMSDMGVDTSVHFTPLHRFDKLRAHARVSDVGVADALAERVMSLPLHVGLSLGDVDRVVDSLGAALRPA